MVAVEHSDPDEVLAWHRHHNGTDVNNVGAPFCLGWNSEGLPCRAPAARGYLRCRRHFGPDERELDNLLESEEMLMLANLTCDLVAYCAELQVRQYDLGSLSRRQIWSIRRKRRHAVSQALADLDRLVERNP